MQPDLDKVFRTAKRRWQILEVTPAGMRGQGRRWVHEMRTGWKMLCSSLFKTLGIGKMRGLGRWRALGRMRSIGKLRHGERVRDALKKRGG